ncbi:MAG: C40 family peptidase [Oscillospiraceae bacterium]
MKKKIVLLVLAVLLCATGVFAIATYVNQDAVLSGVKKVGEVPAEGLEPAAGSGQLPIGPAGGASREALEGQVIQTAAYTQGEPGAAHITREAALDSARVVLASMFGMELPPEAAAAFWQDPTGQYGDYWEVSYGSDPAAEPEYVLALINAMSGQVYFVETGRFFDPAYNIPLAQLPEDASQQLREPEVQAEYIEAAETLAETWLLAEGEAAEYTVGATHGDNVMAQCVDVDIYTNGLCYRMELVGGYGKLPIALKGLYVYPDRECAWEGSFTYAGLLESQQATAAAQAAAPTSESTTPGQNIHSAILRTIWRDWPFTDETHMVRTCLRIYGLDVKERGSATELVKELEGKSRRIDDIDQTIPGDILFFYDDADGETIGWCTLREHNPYSPAWVELEEDPGSGTAKGQMAILSICIEKDPADFAYALRITEMPPPREDLIAPALALVGKPFSAGGSGPESYDDAGLVYACFQAAGIDAQRLPASQLAASSSMGDRVLMTIRKLEDVAPGDILFFEYTDEGVNHRCGVCVGDGKMVMASSIKGKVVELSYEDEAYLGDFAKALRLSAPLPAVEPAATPAPSPGQ